MQPFSVRRIILYGFLCGAPAFAGELSSKAVPAQPGISMGREVGEAVFSEAVIYGTPALKGARTGGRGLSAAAPGIDTPAALVETWLRFHETDLCQTVDTVFVFGKTGMEAWCVAEDDRSCARVQELFEPLRGSCKIEFYITRPKEEKKSDDEGNPPPSIWENYELRAYLGDQTAARIKERIDPGFEKEIFPPDEILLQRLNLYAEQIHDWNEKMKRYAIDLPALAQVACDSGRKPELRMHAREALREHAQNLEKMLTKLESNLRHAFPKSEKKEGPASKEGKGGSGDGTLLESAIRISRDGLTVARRIHNFIHPEHFTVNLDELRQPGLLQALEELQSRVLHFQNVIPLSSGERENR